MIPKRLFYCWFGNDKKPESVEKNIKNWKENNSDFEIVEINESNFNVDLFLFTKEAYENKNWAFVSDVARIWAVNKFGGFYVDTDVKFIRSIPNDFFNYRQIWAKEDSGYVASGLFFGSEKNSSILNEILNYYQQLSYHSQINLKNITTVKIISDILSKYSLTDTIKTDKSSDMLILAPKYFAPLHYWGGGKISSKTIAVHQYKASWVDNKENNKLKKIINYLIHELMYYFPIIRKIIIKLNIR